MKNVSAKKTASKPARRAAAQAVHPISVSQMAPIVKGYYIVKIAEAAAAPRTGSARSRAANILLRQAQVPEIPTAKLEQLIRKIAGSPGAERVARPLTGKRAELASAPVSDPLARFKQEEARRREARIASGELISAEMLSERLGMSTQAISGAVRAGRMFSLEGAGRSRVYPAFYADSAQDRRVLERVTKALGMLPSPSKWQFFTTAKQSLKGKTPLQALADGLVQPVLSAAVAFAER